MTSDFELAGPSWIIEWDAYEAEANYFVEDVYVLVLNTLHASSRYLSEEAEKQQARIESHLEGAKDEPAGRLAQDHADIGIELAEQERFLRNQALVSLMSRLTYGLFRMTRLADTWNEPNLHGGSRHRNEDGRDEFKKIWREYRERFNINFSAKHIGFVDRYRRVRNRIVHCGGQANTFLSYGEIDFQTGIDGGLDESFSRDYPEFVTGEGRNAQVEVTDDLLELAASKSCALVAYAAQQLRLKELDFFKQKIVEI